MKDLHAELEQRKQDGLYRSRRILQSPQGAEITIDGQQVLNFCSNDYLGLANHPDIQQAFIKGIETYGSGSGAAHLVNGHSSAHHALEEELAEFTGYPRALLFSTGYMANLGIAQALCDKGDSVLEDRLNHASLLDAGLLSGARLQRYQHGDISDLENKLIARKTGEKLVMTDGVFSMDGDIAPLNQLVDLCQQQDARLLVDDAHGIGVLGEQGRGSLSHCHIPDHNKPVLMATLGKAFGTAGAFVAGSEDEIEYLIQQARTYVYTTASPPALAEATRTSLRIIQRDDWRRDHLQSLILQFKTAAKELGLPLMDSDTPIQPVIIGDSKKAVDISKQLFQQGIMITAIRPPTVARNTARLRITLSAAHTKQHLDRLIIALSQLTDKA
ncbi:MAG: 8-amino-7-oxononanoate synthase [Gammaproteobacteria bacterium]|nr:8-amino-7-oxononanoate synthase [Gammaproteobacteria bacterium]MCW9005862.1 8-amino-7-oxononanoate synthase [Gammaproteobacteria bacterium]MCW9055332.1 8-amino-7-oxononanoate synthase [Gammaproteobacteria bacterium]